MEERGQVLFFGIGDKDCNTKEVSKLNLDTSYTVF